MIIETPLKAALELPDGASGAGVCVHEDGAVTMRWYEDGKGLWWIDLSADCREVSVSLTYSGEMPPSPSEVLATMEHTLGYLSGVNMKVSMQKGGSLTP